MSVVIPCDLDATKPLTDKKQYRVIVLPCGLRAVLIHDPAPEATEPSAAHDVVHAKDGNEDGSDDEDAEEEDEDGDEAEEDADEEGEEDAGAAQGGRNAAVGFAVGVGSWEDPEAVQGLAHFLEHMYVVRSQDF